MNNDVQILVKHQSFRRREIRFWYLWTFPLQQTKLCIYFFSSSLLFLHLIIHSVDDGGDDDDAMNEKCTRYTSKYFTLYHQLFFVLFSYLVLSTLCSWIFYFVGKFCISFIRCICEMRRWTQMINSFKLYNQRKGTLIPLKVF